MKIKQKIKRLVDLIAALESIFTESHIFAYAAQASFFVIISAVPFLMLVLNILQAVMPVSREYFDRLILEFLPLQVQTLATDIISDLYSNVNISFVSLTTLFLIWTASRGVRAISSGLRVVYETSDDEGYIKSTIWSLIYTVVFMVSIIAVIAILLFGRYIANLISGYLPVINDLISIIFNLRYVIVFVFLTVVFMSAYKFLGKSKMKFSNQFTGAALSSGFWLIFSYVYSLYIQNVGKFSYIYGSLAAVIFLMLWLWFCMISLLFGAEVNRWLYEKDVTLIAFVKRVFFKKSKKTNKNM